MAAPAVEAPALSFTAQAVEDLIGRTRGSLNTQLAEIHEAWGNVMADPAATDIDKARARTAFMALLDAANLFSDAMFGKL